MTEPLEIKKEGWVVTVRLREWHGEKTARMIRAIAPESGDMLGKTFVKVVKDGNDLVLEIEAVSTASCRAVLNSYLRWLEMADKVDSLATAP
jgi:tRNA threonylcarbamoyladenosine modification (KEOPS) complex  Pcc1 subunit